MSDDVFTEPDDTEEEWVDVRMTDPEKGEWSIDTVVVDSHVEYADLHVRPDLLAGFIECLVDDVSTERARSILTDVADRKDIDFPEVAEK